MTELLHGSTFSGIEGIGLGLERAGIPTVCRVEKDPIAQSVLRRHAPTVPLFDDITKVRSDELPNGIVVLSGGFPCQDLSLAGARRGFRGERSGLFHAFMELARGLTPEWILLENVVGLLSSHKGRDMGTLIGALGDCGYSVAWRVLNARGFGVPQKRRRVFIVGHRGDARRAAAVLLEPESVQGNPRARTPVPTAPGAPRASSRESLPVVAMRMRQGKPGGGKGALISEECALTLATGNDQTVFVPEGRGYAVRRFTPVEQERLQGFPEGWTEFDDTGHALSDGARSKLLGNSVAVPVAEWIGRRLRAVHEGRDPDEVI